MQEKDAQVTSGTTATVTLSAPTTAGNLIVVYVIWDHLGKVTLTDTSGNLYANAVGPTLWSNSKYSAQVLYAQNIKGGSNTVQATFDAPVNALGIVYAHEYSVFDRAAPLDVVAAAAGSSGSANSGSAITTSANDLLFGGGVSASSLTKAGTGYMARSMFQGNMTEDKSGSAAGSYSATATNSSGAWAMQMVAFRLASGTSDTTPPSAPTGLSATPVSSSQINLAWTASTDNVGVSGYRIFRNGAQVGAPAGLTYSDTGLSPLTGYSYTVAAYDATGNVSAQSASASATTLGQAPTISSFIASPTAIVVGQSTKLSWSVSGTPAPTVSISSGVGSVTGSSITISPVATTSYVLTATNSAGTVSANVTINVSPDTTPPSVPTGLAANAASSSQINLSWAASTDNVAVTGYRVFRNRALVGTTGTLSYADKNLTAATSYTYSLLAYDAAGNISAQSLSVNATTLTGADTQPPIVSITSPTGNQVISAAWTVTATASDDVGVVGVQFQLDGTNLGSEASSAPYSTNWNTTQTINGSHLLTAVARDAAGNTATSSAVTVTVNNITQGSYSTNFPLTENPISEGGNWVGGSTGGSNLWGNVQTSPGFAFGVNEPTEYGDPTAILTGVWGPNQTVQGTVKITSTPTGSCCYEVELRMRMTISSNSITGYEAYCSAMPGDPYCHIARWNGPNGSYCNIESNPPSLFVANGDVLKATVSGTSNAIITLFLNGSRILQATDTGQNCSPGGAAGPFLSGNPGFGFYDNSDFNWSQFGFSSFMASDGSTADTTPPSVPTNLSANSVSSSEIDLSWAGSTDNVGVAGYQVFRNYNLLGTTTNTQFADTSAIPGTQYTYTVAAYDAAGNTSSQSLPATAATSSQADTTAPSVPTNLQSTNVTSTSVTLSWTASTDNLAVAGYRIFRNGAQVGTTAGTTYTDIGLSPSTSYTYTVAAYDVSGNVSIQSSQLIATTTASAASPPSFVQVTNNQISKGTKVSVAFGSPTQAKNTIVVYAIWNNTGTVTITDSRGDSFVSVGSPVAWGNGSSAQVFYASNIAGGADTVTATFRTSVTSYGVLYVHEYAGISTVNPVDVAASASGSSGSLNSGAVTTTSPNDLIFGAGVSDNTVTGAGSGFISRDLAYGNITEDKAGVSIGSYAATGTHNGQKWGMQIVAFRAGQ